MDCGCRPWTKDHDSGVLWIIFVGVIEAVRRGRNQMVGRSVGRRSDGTIVSSGTIVVRYQGPMVPLYHLTPWYCGTVESWYQGDGAIVSSDTMVLRYHGIVVPWQRSTMVDNFTARYKKDKNSNCVTWHRGNIAMWQITLTNHNGISANKTSFPKWFTTNGFSKEKIIIKIVFQNTFSKSVLQKWLSKEDSRRIALPFKM